MRFFTSTPLLALSLSLSLASNTLAAAALPHSNAHNQQLDARNAQLDLPKADAEAPAAPPVQAQAPASPATDPVVAGDTDAAPITDGSNSESESETGSLFNGHRVPPLTELSGTTLDQDIASGYWYEQPISTSFSYLLHTLHPPCPLPSALSDHPPTGLSNSSLPIATTARPSPPHGRPSTSSTTPQPPSPLPHHTIPPPRPTLQTRSTPLLATTTSSSPRLTVSPLALLAPKRRSAPSPPSSSSRMESLSTRRLVLSTSRP